MASLRTISLVVLCLFVITIPSPAAALGPNLVTNGGFDTSTTGWTPLGNDGAGGFRATTGGSPAFSGNPSGYFIINAGGAFASDPSISQTVSGLVAGQQYQVSGERAWSHTCCGNANALSFGVEVVGVGVLERNRLGLAHGAWTPFTYSFIATSTSHTIRFTSERNGDDSSYGIDNIALQHVPEPTPVPEVGTLMLGAAGVALIAGVVVVARRRR